MTQPRYYAGIGSRSTPEGWWKAMTMLGFNLAHKGYTLRSGHAEGADMAFEHGCDTAKGPKQIFLPWDGFNNAYADSHKGFYALSDPRAEAIAREVHPAWDKLSQGAKKLHTRNVHQLFGIDLLTPVEFVICWTPNGQLVGGTATALKLALDEGIPIYNLGTPGDDQRFAAERLQPES